jgi:mitogen-activated protein kinase kinase
MVFRTGAGKNADTLKTSYTTNPSLQPKMASPAPLLRPPIPGSRQNGGARTPRLGLAIPPSPSAKPLNGGPAPQGLTLQMPGQMGSRPSLPRLQLATPMGSSQTPYEQQPLQNGRPNAQPAAGQSASGGSESSAAHSRSGSFGPLDGRASGPTSAGSQYSALSFASQYGLRQPQQGTPDPSSAVGSLYSERSEGGVGMERDGSMNGLEGFDKLSLEKGRTLDVEDLDDDGWRIASMEKRIEELSSLGEGAGGAVTKCILKGGKTIFALKVRILPKLHSADTTDPYR